MEISVSIEERVGMLQIEVLELEDSIWPPGHHCLHKFIHNLRRRYIYSQTMFTTIPAGDLPMSQ